MKYSAYTLLTITSLNLHPLTEPVKQCFQEEVTKTLGFQMPRYISFFITLHFLEEWRLHLMIVVAALLKILSAEFPYGLNLYHPMK